MLDGFSLPSLDHMNIPPTFPEGNVVELIHSIPSFANNECDTCRQDLWNSQYLFEHDYFVLQEEIEGNDIVVLGFIFV